MIGHPKVCPDRLHVRFMGYGAFSLEIEFFAYLKTRDWLVKDVIIEHIDLRIVDIVKQAGTGIAFPSQTACLARDTGSDAERTHEAEAEVRQWRNGCRLRFPEFAEEERQRLEDSLDNPQQGSPDFH